MKHTLKHLLGAVSMVLIVLMALTGCALNGTNGTETPVTDNADATDSANNAADFGITIEEILAANDISDMTANNKIYECSTTYYDAYGEENSTYTIYIFKDGDNYRSIVKYKLEDESECYELNCGSLVYKLVSGKLYAYCFVPETGEVSFELENDWFSVNEFAQGGEIIAAEKNGIEFNVTIKKSSEDVDYNSLHSFGHNVPEGRDVYYDLSCDAITLRVNSYICYYRNSSDEAIMLRHFNVPLTEPENVRKIVYPQFTSDNTRTINVIVDPALADERVLEYKIPKYAVSYIQPLDGYEVYTDAEGTTAFDSESYVADEKGNYSDLTLYYIKRAA